MNENDGMHGSQRPTGDSSETWGPVGWQNADANEPTSSTPADGSTGDAATTGGATSAPRADETTRGAQSGRGEHHFSGVFGSAPAVSFGPNAGSGAEPATPPVAGNDKAPAADDNAFRELGFESEDAAPAATDHASSTTPLTGADTPTADASRREPHPFAPPATSPDDSAFGAGAAFGERREASRDDSATAPFSAPSDRQQVFGGQSTDQEPSGERFGPFGQDGATQRYDDTRRYDATQQYEPTQQYGQSPFERSDADASTTRLPDEQAPAWGESAPYGAPPVALPGDRNLPYGATSAIGVPSDSDRGGASAMGAASAAGFGASGHGAPTAPGYGAGGPAGPGSGGGGSSIEPAKPKKKGRRGLIIAAAAVAVLLVAAAVLIPLFLHQNNVNRGNDLAAAYDQQVADFEAALSGDNIAALTAFAERPGQEQLSAAAASGGTSFYDLSSAAMDAVKASCTDIVAPEGGEGTLTTTLNEITAVQVPELPADKDAEASEAYVAAQQKAADLGAAQEERGAAIAEMDGIVTELGEYCANIGAYDQLNDKLNSDISGVLADSFVIPEGGSIESADKTVVWPCESPGGCTDLYNANNRKTYTDAYTETYVNHYRSLSELYSTQCFMSAFQDVCAVAATEYTKVADAHQAFVDYLTNNEPTVKVGELMYPDLQSKWDAALAAQTAAETALVDKWKELDPSASFAGGGSTPMKPTSGALATFIQAKEDRFAELLTQVQPAG